METVAVWTLWLISWGPSISTAADSPAHAVVTPLSTYTQGNTCYAAINTIRDQLKKSYAPNEPPSPGMMICVPGAPVKR